MDYGYGYGDYGYDDYPSMPRMVQRAFSDPDLGRYNDRVSGPPIRNMRPGNEFSRRFEEQGFSGSFEPEFDDYPDRRNSRYNREEAVYARVNKPRRGRSTSPRRRRPRPPIAEHIPRPKYRDDEPITSKPRRFDIGQPAREPPRRRPSPPRRRPSPPRRYGGGYRRRSFSSESSESEEYIPIRRPRGYPDYPDYPPMGPPMGPPPMGPPMMDEGPPARFMTGPYGGGGFPPRPRPEPYPIEDKPPARFIDPAMLRQRPWEADDIFDMGRRPRGYYY